MTTCCSKCTLHHLNGGGSICTCPCHAPHQNEAEWDWEADKKEWVDGFEKEYGPDPVHQAVGIVARTLYHSKVAPSGADASYITNKITSLFVSRAQIAEVVASKDNAYHERDMLVCALTKVFPAYLARHSEEDKGWEDDWRWIVYIELPTGQVSWHIHDKERAMFDHLEIKPNEWDGHNTERKYQRLAALEALKAKLINPK